MITARMITAASHRYDGHRDTFGWEDAIKRAFDRRPLECRKYFPMAA
jgi:hypothetical protein